MTGQGAVGDTEEAFADFFKGADQEPVSYTHLDVYKRQLYARTLGLQQSQLLDAAALDHFQHETTERVCQLCGNHCKLTVNTFNNGRELIAGNRCERPVKSQEQNFVNITYNAFRYKRDQILRRKSVKGNRGRIGLPMGLNLYENYHFWQPILTSLGYEDVSYTHLWETSWAF